MKSRVLVLLMWAGVAAASIGLHPALRDGTPLGSLSHQIAADAETQREHLKPYWNAAGGALLLSLLYMTLYGLFRMTPGGTTSELPWPLGLGVVLGQVATFLAGDVTTFYFLAAGIPALSLPFLRRSPETAPPRHRILLTALLGLLLVLLAAGLDAGLASLTGAPLLPEAWFPVAVESWPLAVAVSAVLLAACAALALPRAGALAIAPACVLVLGPSSPFKGLAIGLVFGLLAGPLWRLGFAAIVLGIHIGIAIRM